MMRMNIARRDFLKLAGAAAASTASPDAFAYRTERVVVVVDPANDAAGSGPVRKALDQLSKALTGKGMPCSIASQMAGKQGDVFCIVVAAADSIPAQGFPRGSAMDGAESLRIVAGRFATSPALLVAATDALGFVYAILELTERVRYGQDPAASLYIQSPLHEKPANTVRCVSRYFCGELEDKSWYTDKAFWGPYLDTLVASRFNRFTLAYGLEYDFPRGVTDDYLHFPYPYLVDVPGYADVRVMQLAAADGTRLATPVALSSAERETNFEMLRYIAAETGARGLHFQLGIWTHAYQWTDSPNAYHRIEGLTPETHAQYSRDALAILLKECPQIEGLTMRVHGESGIPEGSYPFWKTLFEAISSCGRKIEIDMHAKGVNQTMIDIAVATGMPVKLGAKYSAEHQSLGYQQADIRALEIPHEVRDSNQAKIFSVSGGARLFTRYGYGDFLRADTPYRLLFRSWPGTQRHLLSADPEMASAYARSASLCGAAGLDLMEPLTFKGREGSGVTGGRCAYADASLNPQADWQKYEYYYRVWGRKLYDPDAEAETWRRYLRTEFGSGAIPVETSLAQASRILPLLTSSHLDSASNHDLWYEMPTNMPIVEGSEPSPYGDTPQPKIFSMVSPLDPQMFSTVSEYTKALLAAQPTAKYSPVEVAQWIEDAVAASQSALKQAKGTTPSPNAPQLRRVEEDVLIQIGLGTFFAHKLRSGVLYEIFTATGSPEAGKLAVEHYQDARDVWSVMAGRASRVYVSNVSYGDVPKRRGHWMDRLPGIDTDLSAMKAKVAAGGQGPDPAEAILIATGKPERLEVACTHTPPAFFIAGQPLTVTLAIHSPKHGGPLAAKFYYRHVDQAERWKCVDTAAKGGRYEGTMPGDYTHSEYALQYYFEIQNDKGASTMHPGLNRTLSNQPYFAVQRQTAGNS